MNPRTPHLLVGVMLAALLSAHPAVAAPTITCGSSPLVLSEVFDCAIPVTLTGLTPNTNYTLTVAPSTNDVLINGATASVTTPFTTGSEQASYSASYNVRCSGAQANGGFVTITLSPSDPVVSCTVQVICKPAVTTGPGAITMQKNNQCTTFKLTLQAMGCVTGKLMKPTTPVQCVTVAPDPANIVPTQQPPAQAANATAEFTVCCLEGPQSKTVQVSYSIDPPEPLSDSYDYSHMVTCTKVCPTKGEGQNSAGGSGPMDGYIAPDEPLPGSTRVSFDMLGVDFSILPDGGLMFFYGTPTGPNMFIAQATLEDVQTGQVHIDQPSEVLMPFFNGQWLDYFVLSKNGELLFLSVPKPCENPCPADLNNTGAVDIDDLFSIIENWGPCAGCVADLNENKVVDIDDLFVVLGQWGPCGNG